MGLLKREEEQNHFDTINEYFCFHFKVPLLIVKTAAIEYHIKVFIHVTFMLDIYCLSVHPREMDGQTLKGF